jgi:hypothetical protein
LRYVFRPADALGKSPNLLSINAFKAQGVNFESILQRQHPAYLLAAQVLQTAEPLSYNKVPQAVSISPLLSLVG